MSQPIQYYITTYTNHSHTYVIGLLSSCDAEYRYQLLENEQEHSKFMVRSSYEVMEHIRTQAERNNSTPISLEYGA